MKTIIALLASVALLLGGVSPARAQVIARLVPVEAAPALAPAALSAAPPAAAAASIPELPALSAPALSAPAAAASAPAAAAAASAPESAPAPSAAPAAAPAAALRAAFSAAAAAPAASDDGAARFDGATARPALEPAVGPAPSQRPFDEAAAAVEENLPQRPQLSFPPAAKTALHAVDPAAAIYGVMKLVKDTPFSRDYWKQFRKGAAIDVVSRGEPVFGRPTTVTFARTKRIADLTREDFAGTVPAHMLQIGVKNLRRKLIADLEESRKRWSPEQPQVSLDSKVRVVKFQSYLELFRQTNGPDAVPAPAPAAARAPLAVSPQGELERMSYVLPRAVYLDLDMFDGPVSLELLADMAKLQRTGVYFVALSRKPYAEANAIKDKLVRRLSAYQLSVLMPIRFMMVTDDGAVISELPRGGSPQPVDILRFSPAEIEALRAAAGRAAEQVGFSPRRVVERRQPPLEDFGDDPVGAARRDAAPDPRVRFVADLPKLSSAQKAEWLSTFRAGLAAYGVDARVELSDLPGGGARATVSRTDLAGSMGRLRAALGDKYGLYLNDGDALVLSRDPALMAANPHSLDVGKITGLSGAALADNALGLLLGEHREDADGDLTGSATRIISFSRDRHRYLSEALVQVDLEEQNINFFSGHVVHAAQDWLIWKLQNGIVPTKDEFAAHLRERWNAGMREFKAVGMPPAHLSEGWLNASLTRALNMYDIVVATKKRGEVLVGSEIPNFFVLKDYARRTGALKRRYILHTIFDFIALRPDPKRPGHATLVIYDFKTGPAKTRPKLNKDVQVLTYALFAHEKWVGKKFPAPYFAGGKSYRIDDVSVEFIYSRKLQTTDINRWSLDGVRRKIVSTLNRIHAAEQKMYGYTPGGKPAKKAGAAKKSAKNKKTASKS